MFLILAGCEFSCYGGNSDVINLVIFVTVDIETKRFHEELLEYSTNYILYMFCRIFFGKMYLYLIILFKCL